MDYALLIIAAWALYGVFGPVVLTGKSARHNAALVWEPEEFKNGNDGLSVMVQELGEWRLHKLLGVVAGLGLFFVHPLAGVFGMFMADSFSRKVPAIDYAGHGAEIIHAEKAGLEGYREAEIDRMIRFDNRQNMTPEEVELKLRKWHWLARVVHKLGSW